MKRYSIPNFNPPPGPPPLRRGRLAGLLFILMTLLPALLPAQDCTMACNGSLYAPVQVAIDQSCMANIVPDNLLEAPQACPGPKRMVMRDSFNTVVAQGIDLLSFDGSLYIGQTFSVKVIDTLSGLACTGYITIADNLAPVISDCTDQTVTCLQDLSTASLGYPDVTDNCSDVLLWTVVDSIEQRDCLSDTAAVIERTFVATDGTGLRDTCVQQITVMRARADSVVFPADVVLGCDNPFIQPDSTGWPTLDSLLVQGGGYCGFTVEYTDDTLDVCSARDFVISREWTVTEDCSGYTRTHNQTIQVRDNVKPVITCPAPIVVPNDPQRCYATVVLPQATATDNCSNIKLIKAVASYGQSGYAPHATVPIGQHTVTYTAIDSCGNAASCTVQLEVRDTEAPTAVCEDETIVSLPGAGVAYVNAVTFDDGSNDNCVSQVFFKAVRMDAGGCDNGNGDDSSAPGYQEWFDDKVLFCCEDIDNGPVMVRLRVYDRNPGAGPVNPTRELPGGDLYGRFTECMTLVTIKDALPPMFVTCPPSATVDCSISLDNLSMFGSPLVTDNCGFTLDLQENIQQDDCGEGRVVRKWTAVDDRGNTSNCTQIITLRNTTVLRADQIVWPQNYESNVCGTPTSPDDLPPGYRYPQVNAQTCGHVVYSYDDSFFDVAQPACFKVLRKWKVIDWCHYDEDNPTAGGLFTHTQVIKVTDGIAPTIHCPADITVSLPSGGCTDAYVNLAAAIANDCSPKLTITNNSPFATANGPVASGRYPLGETTVTYQAQDGCGNKAHCKVKVKVEDQVDPALSCINGLSVSLSPMNGEPMAMVDAATFVASITADNCGGPLKLGIRRAGTNSTSPPQATQLTFTCIDRGKVDVEIWATDLSGNSSYCETYIQVQDNAQICPSTNSGNSPGGPNTAMVAGGILTDGGQQVQSVHVSILGTQPHQMATGLDGAFSFYLPMHGQYTVQPVRNDDPLNGVSTLDLILISKHVLGTATLSSPYRLIAADVDKSGGISTLDIIRLRKVVLGISSQFPNGNTSWRFVSADFQFPNPANPWETYFPEVYTISDLSTDMIDADFVAIKVGDVNGSAVANNLYAGQQAEARSPGTGLELEVTEREFAAGEEFEIPVTAPYLDEWIGYQFTLQYDAAALEVLEVIPGSVPNLYPENFGWVDPANGILTTNWYEFDESVRPAVATELFRLRARARRAGLLSEQLMVSSRYTTAEAYTRSGEVSEVGMIFTAAATTAVAGGFELYQNRPNPWNDETIIPFQLERPGRARLSIYDVAGKLVYSHENHFEAGYHELGVSHSDLPATGIFYYSLESNEKKATRKMVLSQ